MTCPGDIYFLPTRDGLKSVVSIKVERREGARDWQCRYITPHDRRGETISFSGMFLVNRCWRAYDAR